MVNFFQTRCPNQSAPNYFGSLVTYDGIHLSASAHVIVADVIAARLNSFYDLEPDL